MDNYTKLVERISNSAGVTVEDVERRIEAKRAKLSGLVSKEGAAQIVAAELGVNFELERMKISELVQGMKRVNVLGKIIEIMPVREYDKNGRQGKIGRLIIADESGNCRVVLWDTNHISLIEQDKIKKGDVLEISNGNMKENEIHLSSFSDIKKSNEKIDKVISEKVFTMKKLSDISAGQSISTRAVIVQMFEPRYFEVCPECGKRVHEEGCAVHGKVEGKKRALLNFVLDDGTGSIRCVLFGDEIKRLGLTDEEIFSLEKFAEKKNALLGDEKIFTGNIRSNQLYNTIEFSVEKVDEINVDALIKELEAKA